MERIQKSIHGVCLNKTFPEICDMISDRCKEVATFLATAVGVIAVGAALAWADWKWWEHCFSKWNETLAEQDSEILGEDAGNEGN